MKIRQCSVAEIFDAETFESLVAEYKAESLRNPHMISTGVNRGTYEAMAAAGVAKTCGVFDDDGVLIGFCVVLLATVPHYEGMIIATTETLFISASHRSGRDGVALIRFAEDVAREAGAKGLYVTAPIGGRLERLAPSLGYHPTNIVSYRPF